MPFPLSSSSLGSLLSTWSQVCLSRQSGRGLCMVKPLMLKPNLLLWAPQLCHEIQNTSKRCCCVSALSLLHGGRRSSSRSLPLLLCSVGSGVLWGLCSPHFHCSPRQDGVACVHVHTATTLSQKLKSQTLGSGSHWPRWADRSLQSC